MEEIRHDIRYVRIIKSNIEISRTLAKSFEIKLGCRATAGTPKKAEDKRAILKVELNIYTTETEDLKIELEADVCFEFNIVPEDYVKTLEEDCTSSAQAKLLEILDDILVSMGYGRLNLI